MILAVVVVFVVGILMGFPLVLTLIGATVAPGLIDPDFAGNIQFVLRSIIGGGDSTSILAAPLFILSGIIMAKGGISEKIFNVFAYLLGHVPGGIPCAVIATCLFYGAISGSGTATCAAVGAMTIPVLLSLGYDKEFSGAVVATAAGLGVIIPPSIPFVVYGTSASVSTTSLFMAGILPGLLIGALLMAYAIFYCRRHGADSALLESNYRQVREKGFLHILNDSGPALLSPLFVLGSIYGGLASPTEAAAISVVYSLLLSVFVYKTIRPRDIFKVIGEGVQNYAALLFIISAAVGFARVLNMLRVPQVVESAIVGVVDSKIALLLIVVVILLIAGCFIDTIPAIMIFTPIFLPLTQRFGVDPIHFGIVMTVALAIGFVTPPMGINLFVASNLTGLPIVQIAKRAIPMIIMFFIALLIIAFVPQLSLLLV